MCLHVCLNCCFYKKNNDWKLQETRMFVDKRQELIWRINSARISLLVVIWSAILGLYYDCKASSQVAILFIFPNLNISRYYGDEQHHNWESIKANIFSVLCPFQCSKSGCHSFLKKQNTDIFSRLTFYYFPNVAAPVRSSHFHSNLTVK